MTGAGRSEGATAVTYPTAPASAGGGDSRKLPSASCSLSSPSIRPLNATSPPQAPSRKAARSASEALSIAPAKISRSFMDEPLGHEPDPSPTPNAEFRGQDCKEI